MNGIATLPSSISDKFRMILSHRFDNIFTRYRHDELGFKSSTCFASMGF